MNKPTILNYVLGLTPWTRAPQLFSLKYRNIKMLFDKLLKRFGGHLE